MMSIRRWKVCIAVSVLLVTSLSLVLTELLSGSDRPAGEKFDGPAELPRVYVKSTLANSPAPGKVRYVGPEENLQQALDNAVCGDTIKLQAGARYEGVWTLPAKKCDDSRWIIIRSSAPDSALPPEGTRITPCYAGVNSLPGRPALNCASTKDVMPHLVFNRKTGNGPLIFAAGANHYRLIGLDLTRHEGGLIVYHLASVEQGGVADHIIYDRLWMHGSPLDEIKGGIQFGGSQYVAVVDSYFSDFHCIARTGACTDAHAIAGGNGNNPMGPYKIVNNFLEASGESIMFGGGPATKTPTDIEIRGNHFFKPLTWMKGQPGFAGGADGQPFIVKNLFELKNAQRVLFEKNLLENSWGGFTQVGFAILLTPRNQPGAHTGLCPACQVTDVTIRYCKISHVAAGMQIANPIDNGQPPQDGQRYSIHDVIIDDIDGERYSGPGKLFQVSQGPNAPTLQNIRIDHITAFPPRVLFNLGNRSQTRMANFVFTNSIVTAGERPITPTAGNPDNCSFRAALLAPKDVLNNCFAGLTFKNNVIIEGGSGWPSDNFVVKKASAVGFVNYNDGKAGDYHLRPDSRFKNAASDGKDLGADVDAVLSAVASIE